MKLPRLKIRTDLDELKEKTEKRFVGIFNHFAKELHTVRDSCTSQISIWKKSEQVKYNEVIRRLAVLEALNAPEVEAMHQKNLEQERAAAAEIEKEAAK